MSGEEKNNGTCEKGLSPFVRNRYFFGKLLTVRDFNLEQSYFINKIRFSHKFLHGYGTVCGIKPEISSADETNLEIRLSSGVAVDCCGNDIVVPSEITAQVENWENVDKDKDIYIYIKYNECEKEPVPNLSNSSVCEEECCNSRIEETFSLYASNSPPTETSVFSVVSHKDDPYEIMEELKEKYYNGKLKNECPECSDEGVLITVIKKSGSDFSIDEDKTNTLRPVVFTNPMLRDIISAHEGDFENPHRVTAEQTGALKSIENLENPGGNIDVKGKNSVKIETSTQEGEDPQLIIDVRAIGTINGVGNTDEKFVPNINIVSNDASIEISEDDENNEINLELSKSLQNQIFNIQKYLKKLEIVFMYVRERALKCTVINFKVIGNEFNNEIAVKISESAKNAVDNKVYEKEDEFGSFLKDISALEMEFAQSIEGSVTEKSLKEFIISIEDLKEALSQDDILKSATLQDEVCFYVLQLEPIGQENNCEKTLNCIVVSFREIANKFGSPTAKEISAKTESAVKDNNCKDENKTLQFIKSLKFDRVLKEIQSSATKETFTAFKGSIQQLSEVLEGGTFEGMINSLVNVCDKASKLKKITLVTVPKLTGIDVNTAKLEIVNAGLSVGKITTKIDNTKPAGTVLNQKPKAGTKVSPDTPVDMVIAKRSIVVGVGDLTHLGGSTVLGGTVLGGEILTPVKKLTDVSGIGSATAKKLTDAGIKSANELANAKPKTIAEILGININKAKILVNNAKKITE